MNLGVRVEFASPYILEVHPRLIRFPGTDIPFSLLLVFTLPSPSPSGIESLGGDVAIPGSVLDY